MTTSGIAGSPRRRRGCDWPSPEMVGVAPTARLVTIIPLVADTSRSESPLLSHLTRAKRTAYPLNESSPDPRRTARRGKTPKTSLEGKMKTDERRTRMHPTVRGVRRRGEGYPCQRTRIIGRRYCPPRNDVYASECETLRKDRRQKRSRLSLIL